MEDREVPKKDRGLGRGLVPFPAAKSACAGACLVAAAAVAAVVVAVLPLLDQRNEAVVDDAAAAAAAREDIAADQIGRKDEEDPREREVAERINGTGRLDVGPLLLCHLLHTLRCRLRTMIESRGQEAI